MLAWLRSFLEESPGVNSSNRLIAIVLTIYAGMVVRAIVGYVNSCSASPGLVDALALVLGTLVVNGAVAISTRKRKPTRPPFTEDD